MLNKLRALWLQFVYYTMQAIGVCAVFPTETVTVAKNFHGPIIFAFTSGTTGRVISAKVKVNDEWYECKGQTIQRIMDMFQVAEGIELDITLDEIADYDAATVKGKQASITLKQISSGDNTKMQLLTIPKGVVKDIAVDMDAMGKKVSTMSFKVVAYHETAATPLYTFDPAAAAA
jgi:hypothetical protein